MMRVQELQIDGPDLRDALPRADVSVEKATDTVRDIVDDVRLRGVEAVLDLAERFDGVRPATVRVPAEEIRSAAAALDADVRAAFEESIRRARIVHREQRRLDHVTEVAPGGRVAERWVPVRRVGMYVPGGQALYPSSVVMNVVPAQEAGVASLAVSSPPQKSNGGLPDPTVLAVAGLLGVDEVYAVGGAAAVAMFAFGLRDRSGRVACERTDMITGPGNVWVAAAKRLVKGVVGIDSEAGPTEVMILADDTAVSEFVAADLISQAEHDPLAACVLVTDSRDLAQAVLVALERQVPATKHSERVRAALAGPQSAILLVSDLQAGLAVVNAYGAEHLEIQTRDAALLVPQVHNAGAVFVGPYAPVSLGDYCAGSNHVLPTGGCACHSSGLSVQSFLRGIHVVEYTHRALSEVAKHVQVLAETEDLPAHGEAVAVRMGRGETDTSADESVKGASWTASN